MKFTTMIATISASLLSMSAMAVTEAESAAFISQWQESTDVSALMQQQSSQDVVELVSAALASDGIDAETLIQTAMQAFPELAVDIASVAREAGIDNEIITTAALLAGIDPTLIGEATAAGIAAPALLAAPSAPGTPSSSGSGQSVSPST
jgi:hypothetical protein